MRLRGEKGRGFLENERGSVSLGPAEREERVSDRLERQAGLRLRRALWDLGFGVYPG